MLRLLQRCDALRKPERFEQVLWACECDARGRQGLQHQPYPQRAHLHAALHRVQDAVSQNPRADWTVPRMADMAHTSPRHLTRLFVEYAQIAPLQYLRRIRLAVAQTALQSGHNVNHAAELAGFSSDTQLRRAWHQLGLPGAPSQARQR